MSDSVQRHPWDSPGKNTGVGCHFLLQCIKVKSESEVAQSWPTLRDPMDCNLPGFSSPWDFPGKSTGVGCHHLLRQTILQKYNNLNSMILAQKEIQRSTEQNSKPRNKPRLTCSINISQRRQEYSTDTVS